MILCFVKLIGKENDGIYRYNFVFANDKTEFIITDEDYFPACLSNNIDVIGDNIKTYIVKTDIKLDLIQNNCCFSFLHAETGCVAIAYENIDNYEDFPEEGRLVFMFGEPIEEVERKLAIKNIIMM